MAYGGPVVAFAPEPPVVEMALSLSYLGTTYSTSPLEEFSG